MGALKLRAVTKSYSGTAGCGIQALENIGLELDSGAILVLAGASGAGKSTLLRLIAGLETPDQGDIILDDVLINHIPPHLRKIGMVGQNHPLYPHLTTFENLALPLRLDRVSNNAIHQRVVEIASLLQIEKIMDRLPGSVSGGERQRIALGKSLIKPCSLLLLDEPFSHLDPPLRLQSRLELIKLQQSLGMSMIYVTHDGPEAMALPGKVALLRQGRIVQQGDIADLYRNPVNCHTARFFGNPPINLIAGTVQNHQGKRYFFPVQSTSGWELPVTMRDEWLAQVTENNPVILGVRPEDVHLRNGEEAQRPFIWISASVEAIEFAGSHYCCRAQFQSNTWTFFSQQSPSFRLRETVEFGFLESRCYWFSGKDESCLSHPL